MDKTLTLMGIGAILIGIGFGVYDFLDGVDNMFYRAAGVWTVGAITLVLGRTLFDKEEDSIAQ